MCLCLLAFLLVCSGLQCQKLVSVFVLFFMAILCVVYVVFISFFAHFYVVVFAYVC